MHTLRNAFAAALVAGLLPAATTLVAPDVLGAGGSFNAHAAPFPAHGEGSAHLHTGVSGNWAGPVLTGATYNTVRTTFVLPPVSCPSGGGFMLASFWAGIDGAKGGSGTVEQAGIDAYCDEGAGGYRAWTEQYPDPSEPLPARAFTPAAGDEITVSVAVRHGIDTYAFSDLTTGRHYETKAPSPSHADRSSAECIAEAPTGRHGLEKLPDFGTVTFSGCTATVVGASGDCDVLTGNGCPSPGHVTLDNIIGLRFHFIPVVKATTQVTGGGGFEVTRHHA